MMNGFEALDLMKLGKTVRLGRYFYSMQDGKVVATRNYNTVVAKVFPINAEGFVAVDSPKAVQYGNRVDKGETFYAVTRRCKVEAMIDEHDKRSNEYFNSGNYFTGFDHARYVARMQELLYKSSKSSYRTMPKKITESEPFVVQE